MGLSSMKFTYCRMVSALIRTLQPYVCGFEQVKLYVSSNIPFVTIDATVCRFLLAVIELSP